MGDELEKHYTLKIDLFVKIDPQKFRLEYQGARDVILRKSIFLHDRALEISFCTPIFLLHSESQGRSLE